MSSLPTVAPTPQACTSDDQCPNATICFSGSRTAWVKQAYGALAGFCGCSRARGFVGYPECNTPSASFYAEAVLQGFLFLILGVTLFVCIRHLVLLRKLSKLKVSEPLTQTSAFVFLATISHITGIGFTRSCSLNDNVRVIAAGFKFCPNTAPLLLFTILGTVFSFLCQANVAVVWLELVSRLEKSDKSSTRMLRNGLYSLEIIFFALLMWSAATLQLIIAIISSVIFSIILGIAYVIGGCSLRSILRTNLIITQEHMNNGYVNLSSSTGNRSAMADLEADPATVSVGRRPTQSERRFEERQKLSNAVETSLRRVEYVTFTMGIMLAAEIGATISSSVLTIRTGGLAYEEDSFYRPLAISLWIQLTIMILLNVIVTIYIHSSVSTRFQGAASAQLAKGISGDAKREGESPNSPIPPNDAIADKVPTPNRVVDEQTRSMPEQLTVAVDSE